MDMLENKTAYDAALDMVETMDDPISARMIENSLTTNNPHQMVMTFHKLYSVPAPDRPVKLSVKDLYRRLHFILSEYAEVMAACGAVFMFKSDNGLFTYVNPKVMDISLDYSDGKYDEVEIMDGLADVVYVSYGMAIEMGRNLPAVLREVQASNMTKLGADGKPILNKINSGDRTLEHEPEGKVIKGPNYVKPNVARVLELAA